MMDSVIILMCDRIPARLPGLCICIDGVAIKRNRAFVCLLLFLPTLPLLCRSHSDFAAAHKRLR